MKQFEIGILNTNKLQKLAPKSAENIKILVLKTLVFWLQYSYKKSSHLIFSNQLTILELPYDPMMTKVTKNPFQEPFHLYKYSFSLGKRAISTRNY